MLCLVYVIIIRMTEQRRFKMEANMAVAPEPPDKRNLLQKSPNLEKHRNWSEWMKAPKIGGSNHLHI